MSQFPITQQEYLKAVARETARMSYPGRMGGVLGQGTKKDTVEKYFVERFPLQQIWDRANEVAANFDVWHKERVHELSEVLDHDKRLKNPSDQKEAVAAKLLNTFLHQLMKYERCRPLWNSLHLPLDGKTLKILQTLNCPSLIPVKEIIKRPPYSLSYDEYCQIQHALRELVVELNKRTEVEYNLLTSRIELNLLWAD